MRLDPLEAFACHLHPNRAVARRHVDRLGETALVELEVQDLLGDAPRDRLFEHDRVIDINLHRAALQRMDERYLEPGRSDGRGGGGRHVRERDRRRLASARDEEIGDDAAQHEESTCSQGGEEKDVASAQSGTRPRSHDRGARRRREHFRQSPRREAGCRVALVRQLGHGCRLAAGGCMARRASRQDVVDVLGHLLAVLVTLHLVLGQGLAHDQVEGRRQAGHSLRGRDRVVLHHPHQDRGQRAPVERPLAGQQLVEHAAQGEEIAPPVERRLPARLLRRHEGRGTEELAGRGQGRGRQLGDAEVHDLRLAGRGHDHDVRGLDVAVNDPLLVRMVERFGQLLGDTQGLAPVHGHPVRRDLGQGVALEVLQGDVHRSRSGVAADVMNDHDSGMLKPRRGAGFGEEALLERGPLALGDGKGELDGLQSHEPAQVGVVRTVDDAHHPASELSSELGNAPGSSEFPRSPRSQTIPEDRSCHWPSGAQSSKSAMTGR